MLSPLQLTIWRIVDLFSANTSYLDLVNRLAAQPATPASLEEAIPALSRGMIAQVTRQLCGANLLIRIDRDTPWDQGRYALTPAGKRLVAGLARLREREAVAEAENSSGTSAPRRARRCRSLLLVRKVLRRRGAAALLMRVPLGLFTIDEIPFKWEISADDMKRGLVLLYGCEMLTQSRSWYRSGREYQLTPLGRRFQSFFLEIEEVTRPPEEEQRLSPPAEIIR